MKKIVLLIIIIVQYFGTQAQTPCTPSGKVSASHVLSVYLSSILCQNEGLFKDCNGVYSRELADTYINNLKAAMQTNPAFEGINLTFPANNDAILTALQSGNCEAAGNAMATEIEGDIDVEKYNEDILGTYDDIFDNLLPKELELSMTTEQPSCSLPNGKITITVKNGTPPFQYSIDGGKTWQESNVFELLAIGTYTINVKDEENNEGRLSVILEQKETFIIENIPTIGIIGNKNLRLSATNSNSFVVKYADGYNTYTIHLKDGFEANWDGNRNLTITKVPADLTGKIDPGTYTAGFKESNLNEFIGFYNFDYQIEKGCTPSKYEYNCKALCLEGFLKEEAYYTAKKRLSTDLTSSGSQIYTPNLDKALIDEIDILLDEMVADGEYESFIKSGLIIYKKGKPLDNNNLRALKQLLLDYKAAQIKIFGGTSTGSFQIILKILKECANYSPPNNPDCVVSPDIVPRCIWDNPISAQAGLPFFAGVVDGVAGLGIGVFDLFKIVNEIQTFSACWINPYQYLDFANTASCKNTRQQTIDKLFEIKEIIAYGGAADALSIILGNAWETVKNEMFVWKNQIICNPPQGITISANCCAYQWGKSALDFASLFFGIGEIRAGMTIAEAGAIVSSKTSQMMAKFGKFFNPTNVLSFGKRIASTTFTEIRFLGQTLSQLLFKADALAVAGFEFRGITRPLLGGELDDLVLKFKAKPSTLGEKLEHSIKKPNGDLLIDTEEGYLLMQTINEGNQKGIGFFKKSIKNGKAIRQLVGYLAVAATTEQMLVPNSPVDIEDEPDEDCPTCNKAYWPCLVYKAATYSGKKAALDKLCTLNPTKKDAICQEIYLYSQAEIDAFLEDLMSNLSNNDALSNHVSNVDVALVRAWKAITDAATVGTAFARDYPLLVKIKDIRADNSKQSIFKSNTIADFQQFLRAYNITPCNTCPAPASGSLPSFFPKLDEILENTVEAYQTHNTKTGFTTFFTREPLSNGNNFSKDGGQHMLKYMADNSFTDNAVGFDGVMINGSQYDIYLGSTANIRYIECKSYQEETELNTTKGVNQLLGYLSQADLTNLSQIRYVFNAKKLTLQQAKEKMQAVFRNNAQAIFNALNSTGKFQQLFGVNNVQDFLDDIVPLSNTYDFVITN